MKRLVTDDELKSAFIESMPEDNLINKIYKLAMEKAVYLDVNIFSVSMSDVDCDDLVDFFYSAMPLNNAHVKVIMPEGCQRIKVFKCVDVVYADKEAVFMRSAEFGRVRFSRTFLRPAVVR